MRRLETVWLDVERRMRRGERFGDVEDIIDASDLSPEEKSAVWLLAWSYVHPRAQRREANAHLAHLTAARPPRFAPSPSAGQGVPIKTHSDDDTTAWASRPATPTPSASRLGLAR